MSENHYSKSEVDALLAAKRGINDTGPMQFLGESGPILPCSCANAHRVKLVDDAGIRTLELEEVTE